MGRLRVILTAGKPMHLSFSRTGAAIIALAVACSALPAMQASSQTTSAQKTDAEKQAAIEKKKAERKAASEAKKKFSKALQGGEMNEKGLYQMSQDELAMDCKRLTGSIKIIVNRLRDAQTRKDTSNTAQTMHKLFGGSTAGADRQAMLSRERAKLDAYNGQLAARNCKTVDIEAELARAADPPKKY
jgi:hypothetical protein